MAELARGTVLDRPWGRTLAALGLRGLTGQLTVMAESRPYQIAFDQGIVIGASSPLASDSAARVALTGHLISSTQVADIARRQAAAPARDEIEVIAEAARLAPEQALRLRRRVIAQRAARTFGIERGEFVVHDEITLPAVPGCELDIRSIIYMGAKQMISEARLNSDLGQLGAWFQLKPDLVEDLAQFGFGPAERVVLEPLTRGAGLAALERPELEQRMVRAVVYALVTCNMCVVEAPSAAAPSPAQAPTRRATLASTRSPQQQAQAAEVEALIKARLAVLDGPHDHFSLLGVARDATPAALKTAYFALAQKLHPDKLNALGIADDARRAQRLFAEVNTAFSVLSDRKRRDEYLQVLERGGEAAVRDEQAQAEAIAQRVLESEEAFRRGELALRRDQIAAAVRELERAIELNPDEPDYHAALAWARFCAADDKAGVAHATRAVLERAIARSPRAVAPRFYLGRVERMLGRDAEALRHFEAVVAIQPNHADAATEVRLLEARLSGGDKSGGSGLFGRLKR